jgi:tRNA C32,U32 (ribose-2'-O)-methylase TrmJ
LKTLNEALRVEEVLSLESESRAKKSVEDLQERLRRKESVAGLSGRIREVQSQIAFLKKRMDKLLVTKMRRTSSSARKGDSEDAVESELKKLKEQLKINKNK